MKKLLLLASVFAAGSVSAQTIVSTDVENRNAVLEEFTGKTCTFCPDGHKRANEFAEANPGDVVLINIHCGNYATGTPNYNVMLGESPNETNYGDLLYRHPDVKLLGFPAGIVNRRHFQGYEQVMPPRYPTNPGAISQSRGSWATTGAMVLGETSPVNVAVQSVYDPLAGRVYVKVEAFYTNSAAGDSSYLHVGVLQNNIWGPQTGMTRNPDNVDNSRPTWSSTDPNSGRYKHMHMLRDVLTGQWGQKLEGTSAGTFHDAVFVWEVPTNINDITVDPLELEVYAFITTGQMGVESGTVASVTASTGQIDPIKFEEEKVFDVVGVEDVEEDANAPRIYPNPTVGNVFVKLNEGNINDVKINIYTATGQKVVESSSEQLNEKTVKLDVSNFIDGFYFVEVTDGESVIARETVIKR